MVGVLTGAKETKVRPAVVIASATYLAERPDVLVGILTTKLAKSAGHNGSHSPGLAICRAPRRIMLPSVRIDGSSLGVERNRPSERA